jgi:ribose transport system substrate-binding protein
VPKAIHVPSSILVGVVTLSAMTLCPAALGNPTAAETAAAAKAAVEARTATQTTWLGPTTGPRTEPGKFIVYISTGENNPIGHLWGAYLQEAAAKVGWRVTVLDGKSSPAEWVNAAKQAVTLKPDGIVTSADAKTMQAPLSQAHDLGIPIVGLHGTAKPGPDPDDYLFTNIVSNPTDIGRAMVQWAVADANGEARIIFLYDAVYAISMIKRTGWQEALQACPTCKLLKDDNFPIAEVPNRMRQEAITWAQQYQKPFYVVAVADYYYDFAVPALREAGIKTGDVKLIGADGTKEAYERVRAGDEYQIVTIPEPIELQSWQALDEVNRAIHKQPPSNFVQPVYIVTKSNVDSEGGSQNQFVPSNNYRDVYAKIWLGGS